MYNSCSFYELIELPPGNSALQNQVSSKQTKAVAAKAKKVTIIVPKTKKALLKTSLVHKLVKEDSSSGPYEDNDANTSNYESEVR